MRNPSQARGRLRLAHLQEFTEAAGERMAEERPRFQRLAMEDSAPRVVSAFNLFQTPEALADRMAGIVGDGRPIGRVLEPSAGLGRLYRAVRAVDKAAPFVLVEIARECCAELYRETADGASVLVQADFLARSDLGTFNSVVMNPPFKQGRDVKHIRHALGMLAPGGRLVALCANGPRQREHLKPLATYWEELPARSFAEAGTSVDVALLIVDR